MSIWISSFVTGDANRILGTIAYDGTICGVDTPDAKGYFPQLNYLDFKMCGSSCAVTGNMTIVTPPNYWFIQFTPGGDVYPIFPYPSTESFGICIPDMAEEDEEPSEEKKKLIMNLFISDMHTALWVFGVSALVALVLSFIYLKFVEMCAGCLIWGTLACTLISGLATGYILLKCGMKKGKAGELELYLGYVFLGATGIWLLILIFLRGRIRIAIQVMKSATRAITDMKSLLLTPIPMSLAGIAFLCGWIFAMLFITSVGKFEEMTTPDVLRGVTINNELIPETYKVFVYDKDMNETIWANVFFMFWVLNFIIYLLYLTIAGAVADWYFTRRDEKGDKIRGTKVDELSNSPICKSFCRTIRYHLGTIAFASLIIAIIQTIRAFVAYLEKTAGQKKTKIQKMIFKLIHCLLWIAEKCMDKISKNALIFTAIYGHALCPAAFASFKLIWL